jgi:uncharacterized membrane protein
MSTDRLEAFSDGVLAVIITIMVLELRTPEGRDLQALRDATGTGFLTYLLSFVYIGIYWNNHHHMFQLTERITGWVLWANLHLLFWLSLVPFTTAWMDESDFAQTPVVLYGVNLFAAAIAYTILQAVILRGLGPDSTLRRAIGRDVKGRISPLLYLAAIVSALFIDRTDGATTGIALALYVSVALIWLIPDTRLERAIVAGRGR